MSMPPYLIDMHIAPDDHRPFRLWLPLFLFWPLFLVLGVLALVFTILADVFLWAAGQRYHYYTLLLVGVFAMFAELRGTSVNVQSPTAIVRFVVK